MFSYKHLRVENLFMNYLKLFFAVILTISIFGFKNINSNQNDFLITTKARIAVEKAWETYHDGALGGTLPSPAIQTDLEMKLHRCRSLLAEAYDAEDKGNDVKAKQLISKIMEISNNVVTESQVPKK
jgi:hypothetical protein